MGSLKFYHTFRFKIDTEGKLSVIERYPYGRELTSTDLSIWQALIKANKWGGLDIPDKTDDLEILQLIEDNGEDDDEMGDY